MREFVLNKDFLTADIILCMYVNLLHSWSRSLEAIWNQFNAFNPFPD